ncbi:MAG: HupE/UreJ family protein [Bacteriovoracaceae bacterium]
MRYTHAVWFLTLSILSTSMAFAHPGHEAGHLSAFFHPFSGTDHFLVAFTVGMMMSRVNLGKEFVPLSFIIGMLLGFFAGASQFEVSFMETGIVLSLCISIALLMSTTTVSMYLGIPLFLLFGFFHGNAHGLELPGESLRVMAFQLSLSTFIIHMLGYGLVVLVRNSQTPTLKVR